MTHHLPAISGAAMLALASTQAAGASCDRVDQIVGVPSGQAAPAASTCTTYLSAAATTGASCYWAFKFRDAAATDFAEMVWRDVQNCRAGAAWGVDQPVNHPDSFTLRIWEAEDGAFRVSVKDKGAQDRTLVFLSFEPSGSASSLPE